MVVDNVDTASATRTLKETIRDQHHACASEDIHQLLNIETR